MKKQRALKAEDQHQGCTPRGLGRKLSAQDLAVVSGGVHRHMDTGDGWAPGGLAGDIWPPH